MSDPFFYQAPPAPPPGVYPNSPYVAPHFVQQNSPFIPHMSLGGSPFSPYSGLPSTPGTSYNRSPFDPNYRPLRPKDDDEEEEDIPPVHPYATKRRLSWGGGPVPAPQTNVFEDPNQYLYGRRIPRRQRTLSDSGQQAPQIVNINNGYWVSPHVSPYGGHSQLPPQVQQTQQLPPVGLHWYLDAALNRGDIAFDLSWPQFLPRLLQRGQTVAMQQPLGEWATHPPMYRMTITIDLLPNWPINIDTTTRERADGRPPMHIRLGDVLYMIWKAMQTRISQEIWANLDQSMEFSVSNAYTNRYKAVRGYMDDRVVRNDGVKRIDFLGGRKWFKGLVRTGEVNTFKLHVV